MAIVKKQYIHTNNILVKVYWRGWHEIDTSKWVINFLDSSPSWRYNHIALKFAGIIKSCERC